MYNSYAKDLIVLKNICKHGRHSFPIESFMLNDHFTIPLTENKEG